MNDTYKTIIKVSKGFYKNKGSKFFSFAFPVENESRIKDILTNLKKEHHSARHHCYGWRLGTEKITFRANDDGEPSSTAGKPILGQLKSFDITNSMVVVVRYFGGILLGTGGLIHAYKTAAADALNNAEIITKTIQYNYKLGFTYNEMGEVMQIINQENLNIVNTWFEEQCRLEFSVRKSKSEETERIFNNLYGVDISRIL